MSSDNQETNDREEAIQKLLKLANPPIDFSPTTLRNLTKLNLPECGLSSLPDDLPTVLPNLSILFCPKNEFKELPAVIGACKNLQMVSFKSNQCLKSIHPDALQPQLRWLILTDNQITHLPTTIGRCRKLQKLMLSGNRLQELPDSIRNCHNLELIRLASNQLHEPPMALLTSLFNLKWIGLSANPFLNNVTTQTPTHHTMITSDDKLQVFEHYQELELLGQGASGVTHRAVLLDDNGATTQHVAIKTYFGSMTSDGDPQQERRLSLTASMLGCSSLIHVLGRTPEGNLVMELLENVVVLAGPPSMETCSRDVYDSNFHLASADLARKIVTNLLEAILKLHSVGICHGDFYGHNILLCGKNNNEVKLSDFGAAFAYERDQEYGKYIERIELRAFTILVDEVRMMVERTVEQTSHNNVVGMEQLSRDLESLGVICNQSTTFVEVQEAWSKLLSSS